MWPHIRNLAALLAGKLLSQSLMTLLGLGLTLGLAAVSIYVGTNKTGDKDAGFFGNIKNAIFTSSDNNEDDFDEYYDDDDEYLSQEKGFFSKLFGGEKSKNTQRVVSPKTSEVKNVDKQSKAARNPAASVIHGGGARSLQNLKDESARESINRDTSSSTNSYNSYNEEHRDDRYDNYNYDQTSSVTPAPVIAYDEPSGSYSDTSTNTTGESGSESTSDADSDSQTDSESSATTTVSSNETTDTNTNTGGSSSTTTGGSSTGGTSGGGSSSSDLTPPLITLSHDAGTYSTGFDLTLTASEAATIYYCVAENSCCSPVNGTVYSMPITVGDDNGSYCVSFNAKDSAGNWSNIVQAQYVIYDLLPNITIAPSSIWLQTTQMDQILEISSLEMGEDGYSFYQLNVGAAVPPLSCEQIVANFPYTTYGMQNSLGDILSDISLFGVGDVITIPLRPSVNLAYGNNYLVSIIKNSNPLDYHLYSCPGQLIVLHDFTVLDPMLSVDRMPASTDGLQGSFIPYMGGVLEGSDQTNLESGLIFITR